MTMSITFDTLKYVEKLKAAGISEPQAKAMLEAQQEVFSEALNTTLATKMDIFAVKEDVAKLKQDMTELRSELKQDITEVKSEMKLMKWMLGLLITGTVVFK